MLAAICSHSGRKTDEGGKQSQESLRIKQTDDNAQAAADLS
jgi:hypothetical protein